MPSINQNNATTLEKVIGGFCYLTFGLVGLLYIIISGGRTQTPFFRFHFLQSIILSIIIFLVSWTSNIFLMMTSSMLMLLGPEVGAQASYWLSMLMTIVVRALDLLLLYGMLWAFLGKYAEIPCISNLVRRQMH